MATWMTHLRIADRFIDIIGENNLDVPCFIFGNLAPDCGVPNGDGKTYTPGKDVSHFKHDGGIDYERFATEYLYGCTDVSGKSFYLGYYVHLMTDMRWILDICRPKYEKYGTLFPDKLSLTWAMKPDWYGQDKLFIKKNPDFRSFRIFTGIEHFPNTYLDFFPADAFERQIDRISGFYRDFTDAPDREYAYLSTDELDAFVDDAVILMRDAVVTAWNK